MEETTQVPYPISEKKTAVINRVFKRFRRMQRERDKERHEFDGLTLTEYVNTSMDAYNGIESDALKATKEDWQSLIWDHKTRSKVNARIAMIVGTRPFLSIVGKTEDDNKYAQAMTEVWEDAWKNENGAYQLYLQAISAVNKGTVIVEELYDEQKVDRKEITSVDEETGQVTFKKKRVIKDGYGCVKSRIFPLLNFYPNENSPDIEHDCTTLLYYTSDAFQNKFGKYPYAQHIKPGVFNIGTNEDQLQYQQISQDKKDLVEVLTYYNEDLDEYIILANGFWINYQKRDEVCPLPFNHKRLPFAKTVYELADEKLFYGQSLPFLMKGEQGARNALQRLMLDQEILKGNKPILLGLGIDIESFELYPGKPMKVNGDITQVQEMDMQGASQSGFQFLQLLKSNVDENTALDPITQGVSGGRKTAREAVILDENAKQSGGPFQLHIYKLLLDRAKLRVENIKQFYKDRIIAVAKPGKAPFWFKMDKEMRGAEFHLRFVEDFEVTENRSYRIEMAKSMLDESKANPLLNADEVTINYLEAIRQNPDRFYIKPKPKDMAFQAGQGVPPQNPQAPQGEPLLTGPGPQPA